METRYYINYYEAKDYARKHGLKECEYGDTGYKLGDGKDVSYVAYNKSGDREDDWEVECYYTWAKNTDGRYKPAMGRDDDMKAWLKNTMGIIDIQGDDNGE